MAKVTAIAARTVLVGILLASFQLTAMATEINIEPKAANKVLSDDNAGGAGAAAGSQKSATTTQHPAMSHPAIKHEAMSYPAAKHDAIKYQAETHPASKHEAIAHPALTHPAPHYAGKSAAPAAGTKPASPPPSDQGQSPENTPG